MQVVLLKNTSRELIPLNVGDKAVTVKRSQPMQTKSGQVGVKHTEHQVSSSITLMPGVLTRVPGIVLKQRAVQRLIANGTLKMVKGEAKEPADEAPQITVEASTPLKSDKGSHPVVEEGTVEVAEVLKKKREKKKAGKGKETEG